MRAGCYLAFQCCFRVYACACVLHVPPPGVWAFQSVFRAVGVARGLCFWSAPVSTLLPRSKLRQISFNLISVQGAYSF